jgi:hypothetical protein
VLIEIRQDLLADDRGAEE